MVKDFWRKTMQWISVKDRLPQAERKVLVSRKISSRRSVCIALYVPKHTVSEDNSILNWNYVSMDYDEEKDTYFVSEGWYEYGDIWDDISAICIGDTVTHWMPLPDLPEER